MVVLHGVGVPIADAIAQRIDLEIWCFVNGGHTKEFPVHVADQGCPEAPKRQSAGNSDGGGFGDWDGKGGDEMVRGDI